MVPATIGKQTVVVGAGMAGLTAARARADHFERVIVMERDTLPLHAVHRAGTPQARNARRPAPRRPRVVPSAAPSPLVWRSEHER